MKFQNNLVLDSCALFNAKTIFAEWKYLMFFRWYHINRCGLFNAKTIIIEQQWDYLTHKWEDKGVYILPMDITPKVN